MTSRANDIRLIHQQTPLIYTYQPAVKQWVWWQQHIQLPSDYHQSAQRKKRVQWQWPPSTTVCSQCRQCMRPKSGEVCIQWWAGPRRAAEAFCATVLRRRRQRFFPSAPPHGTDSQHYVSTWVAKTRFSGQMPPALRHSLIQFSWKHRGSPTFSKHSMLLLCGRHTNNI